MNLPSLITGFVAVVIFLVAVWIVPESEQVHATLMAIWVLLIAVWLKD